MYNLTTGFLIVSLWLKQVFSDSNNIILWHESEDVNKKKTPYFQNFSWFQCYVFKLCMIMCVIAPIAQVMHDYVCVIAPIAHSVKWSLVHETFCENCSHFILKRFHPYSFGEVCLLEESYENMWKFQILTILRAPSIRHQPSIAFLFCETKKLCFWQHCIGYPFIIYFIYYVRVYFDIKAVTVETNVKKRTYPRSCPWLHPYGKRQSLLWVW